MRKLSLLFTVFFLVAGMAQAKVYYVSPSGDNSSGDSWATAYTGMQSALAAAVSGDEVWVAAGEYIIEEEASQLNIKGGVNVFGGFSGTEANRDARSTNPALTVVRHKDAVVDNFRLLFSTDLDDAATWDGFTFDGKGVGQGVHLSGNCTLNNCIVKNCFSINGSGAGVYMASGSSFIPVVLSNSAVTDNKIQVSSTNTFQLGGAGVYIKKGSEAAEISHCEISGNTLEGISESGTLEAMGAGIYLYEGTIRHCVIDRNKLSNTANVNYSNNNFTGGAIAIVPVKTDEAAKSVLIENCTITNSFSNSRGGAIVIDPRWSGQFHGNYTISKTIIANNQSRGVGAGILATAATKQEGAGWTLNIENSVIANNGVIKGSNSAGGGMHINIGCVLNITNTTIVRNYADNYGGGGIYLQGSASHTVRASLKNVVLWGNESAGNRSPEVWQISNGTQASTIIFSAIQEYNEAAASFVGATLGDNVPLGKNNDAIDGPGFVAPTTEAGYGVEGALTAKWNLSSSSILIDAGDDYLADDINGVARPKGDYSDIGAYEYDPNASSLPAGIAKENLRVYSLDGVIVVDNTVSARQVEIYSLMGALVKTQALGDGLNYIPVPAGQLYLLKTGGTIQKVVVR